MCMYQMVWQPLECMMATGAGRRERVRKRLQAGWLTQECCFSDWTNISAKPYADPELPSIGCPGVTLCQSA
jgi:hypothetical protein